jgi:mono/diheme cytochrome c family protein
MRHRLLGTLLIALSLSAASTSNAQKEPKTDGGALLYQTYCIACHTKQIHWRDRKLAADWSTLRQQVNRWQVNGGLQWTDDQIDEVARYLNDAIYHFPEPRQRAANTLTVARWTMPVPATTR